MKMQIKKDSRVLIRYGQKHEFRVEEGVVRDAQGNCVLIEQIRNFWMFKFKSVKWFSFDNPHYTLIVDVIENQKPA